MGATKVGVLGGGQLGRMMALKGAELGYEVHIFSEHSTDPAAQVTRHWHSGMIGSSEAQLATLTEFFKSVDVVTFESEFIPPEPIKAAALRSQVPVRPSIDLMAALRERGSQKALLQKYKVPTTFTAEPRTINEVKEFYKLQKNGIVAKKRLFGYDGYGTFLIRSPRELEAFCHEYGDVLSQFIFEPIVRFKRELAISLARDLAGHIVFFPLVEWKARDKKCHWVKGPTQHKALKALKRSLKNFAQKIDYVGFISFELFDLGGSVVVNEVAPRVHNSAHYSLNALSYDQFQAHLLAITSENLKSEPVPHTRGFAMVNLVGASDSEPTFPTHLKAHLHWYGKTQNRPGRKMGHLNTLAQHADEALRLALHEEKRFKL